MKTEQNDNLRDQQDPQQDTIAAAEHTLKEVSGVMPPALQLKAGDEDSEQVAEVIAGSNAKDETQPIQKAADNENENANDNANDAGQISEGAEQLLYEIIAHGFAYKDALSENQANLLQQLGYEATWDETNTINDQENSGFFAALVVPNAHGLSIGRKSIMAFRGSEMGDQFTKDWLENDMDPYAVGYTAFAMNYGRIQSMLAMGVGLSGGNLVAVTGHSLGGSLAKQAALHFPQFIDTCVTFQAPGIAEEQQEALEGQAGQNVNVNGEDTGDRGVDDINFVSHVSRGDIVHWTGGGRVPGAEEIQHNPDGFLNGWTPLAHTLYLMSSEQYGDEQAELLGDLEGTNDMQSVLNVLSENEEGQIKGEATQTITDSENSEAWWQFPSVGEYGKDLVGDNFHPNSGIINDNAGTEEGMARISAMPLPMKINIMREFMNEPSILETAAMGAVGGGVAGGILGGIVGGVVGFFMGGPVGAVAGAAIGAKGGAVTGAIVGGVSLPIFAEVNDVKNTKQAMVNIIKASSGTEKVQIINALGGLNAVIDRIGKDYNGFYSEMLGSGGYFASLTPAQAAAFINMNLDGGFLGMGDNDQEKLIADCLLECNDGKAVLTLVGGGDYDDGLEKVLRKLQGAEDDLITNRFAFNSSKSRWFW